MSLSETSTAHLTRKSIQFKSYKIIAAKLNSYKTEKENVNEIVFTDKLPSFDELTKICEFFPNLDTLKFFKVIRSISNSYVSPKDEMIEFINNHEEDLSE